MAMNEKMQWSKMCNRRDRKKQENVRERIARERRKVVIKGRQMGRGGGGDGRGWTGWRGTGRKRHNAKLVRRKEGKEKKMKEIGQWAANGIEPAIQQRRAVKCRMGDADC